MKKRNILVAGSLLLAMLSALPASAIARPHHGHGHGGARFGLYIGVPLAIGAAAYYGSHPYYPPSYYYPPAPYYYAPVAPVVVAPAPVTYIEQAPQVAAAPQSSPTWYYCDDAKAYYPYVKECPAGWLQVPATPLR
ncbi:hypothetical protein [Lacisediminimonas profundi]|uniref:hypothetical protein n=1 Tax=Lacisediminimonas profundi TaxID=2603856 RepID=UPI00124B92F8|nr:hypothetical protein [Lacisediminimonas profundi]